MKYAQLYSWPYGDSPAVAKEFFERAKENFSNFPYDEDAAICLCEGPRGSFCLVYLESDSWEDDSVEKSEAIKKFLSESGCPDAGDTEGADWDGQMAIDTIDQSLGLADLVVVDRITRCGVRHNADPSEDSHSAMKQFKAAFESGDIMWPDVRERIIESGGSSLPRELAQIALGFDPKTMNWESSEEEEDAYRMAQSAMHLLRELDELDAENADRIFKQLYDGVTREMALEQNWVVLYSEAEETLKHFAYTPKSENADPEERGSTGCASLACLFVTSIAIVVMLLWGCC